MPHTTCTIRTRRKAAKLKLRQLAEAVGIFIGTVWAIEHGAETNLSKAKKFAEYFGCTIDDLWPMPQPQGNNDGQDSVPLPQNLDGSSG
jgi:transcriptional regulator with XRE-family HTH domain